MILAATGHRPDKLGGYDPSPMQTYVRERLRLVLMQHRPEYVVTGMALGVDTWWAEEAHCLGIPFVAAVPFEGQQNLWPLPSRERYRRLLELAIDVVHVSPPGYQAWKMDARNRWMVDRCDVLVAVYDGSLGGTHNTVAYARTLGRDLVRINPKKAQQEIAV